VVQTLRNFCPGGTNGEKKTVLGGLSGVGVKTKRWFWGKQSTDDLHRQFEFAN